MVKHAPAGDIDLSEPHGLISDTPSIHNHAEHAAEVDSEAWTVEVEPGVWLAPWEGDPGRTLVRQSAKKFISRDAAITALAAAREYRMFIQARILQG